MRFLEEVEGGVSTLCCQVVNASSHIMSWSSVWRRPKIRKVARVIVDLEAEGSTLAAREKLLISY